MSKSFILKCLVKGFANLPYKHHLEEIKNIRNGSFNKVLSSSSILFLNRKSCIFAFHNEAGLEAIEPKSSGAPFPKTAKVF